MCSEKDSEKYGISSHGCGECGGETSVRLLDGGLCGVPSETMGDRLNTGVNNGEVEFEVVAETRPVEVATVALLEVA